MTYPSDIVFSPTVKAIQEHYGSRKTYARMEANGSWNTTVNPNLIQFLEQMDSFYFGTANTDGQPYIQHRGGAKGFLKPWNDNQLAFADFAGNKQYITIGNLKDNAQATIFLMHYPSQTRIKIWGTAQTSEDQALLKHLKDSEYNAKIERAIVFQVMAWDINCRQHIQQRFTPDAIEKLTTPLHQKIKTLEAEIDRLKNK